MIGIDVEDESLNQRPSEDVLLDSSEKAKYYRTRLMLLLKGYINENKKEGLRSYAEHLTVKNATKKRVIPNTTDLCYDLPSSSSDVELLGKSSMGGKKKKYNLFRGKKKCASERLKTYGTFNNNSNNDNDDNININVNADTNSSLSPKASSIQDKRLMMIRSNDLSTSKGNIKGSFDVLSDDEYLKSQTLSTKELMYVLEKNNKRIKGVATIETESMFPELQLELHDLEQGVVVKEMGEFRTNILPEVKRIVSNSIPLIFASICQFVMVFVETSTIGNLGKKELGGYGLGHIFLVFLGLPALVGLSGALETLCSQSTTGKENVKLNEHYQHIINEDVEEVADVIAINIVRNQTVVSPEIYLYRAIVIFALLATALCTFWVTFSKVLTEMFVKDPEILHFAQLYLKSYIPTFFLQGINSLLRQYMYAKAEVKQIPFINFFGTIITVGAAYYYVWSKSGLNLGFVGVPLAMASGNLAMVFALSYIVYRLILKDKKREYFNGTGHQMENCATENCEMCRIIPPIPVLFQGWGQIFKLTIPGMIVMLATAGTNELISVSATYIGHSALSAQSVLNSVSRLILTLFSCFAVVSTNRMGNALGLFLPSLAKSIFVASSIVYFFISVVVVIFVMLDPFWWASKFTKDSELLNIIISIGPYLGLTMLFEIFVILYTGLLRGQGRQTLAAKIKFISFYFVAIPVGGGLAFYYDKGLKGLWIGLILGHLLTGVSELYFLLKTDWNKQVDDCKKRISKH